MRLSRMQRLTFLLPAGVFLLFVLGLFTRQEQPEQQRQQHEAQVHNNENALRRRRRRLSGLDYQVFQGDLNVSTAVPKQDWIFIHIPKTAGDSAMMDSPNHLPTGSTFKGNAERSYKNTLAQLKNPQYRKIPLRSKDYSIDRFLIFIREPVSHVLSQFLECKYDEVWGKRVTKGTGFPGTPPAAMATALGGFDEWVQHFVDIPLPFNYATNEVKFAYKCYNPWNMQGRYLTSKSRGDNPSKESHFCHEEADRLPPLELAKKRLEQMDVVGISSYYTASMCLLEFQALQGNLTTNCRTCDPITHQLLAKSQEHHNQHGVPKHSVDMISDSTLQLIRQNLTHIDQQVYEHALELFHNQVRHVQETLGVDLLCGKGPFSPKVAPKTDPATGAMSLTRSSSPSLASSPRLVEFLAYLLFFAYMAGVTHTLKKKKWRWFLQHG